MPPKGRPKNAPNQHDKRHESGLAPPGKRILKKHSNGQLNGQLNGKPVPAAPSPSLPQPGAEQGFRYHRTAENAQTSEGSKDHAGTLADVERGRTYSDVSLEELGPYGGMGDVCPEQVTPAGDPEAQAAACKKDIHSSTCGSLSGISTLLTNYPLRDAISILILLLSLPPTLVLVIQSLFASLTFVPPTASISLSTIPNVKEMFNSSNFGYPAMATILIVDLIFWVCWLPVWKPVQNVFLDLSQAVIAVSLSGAAASTGGPTYSIATCTSIVCIVHVLRYKAIHLTALDYLRSVLHKLDIGFDITIPSFASNIVSVPNVDRGWVFTVVRIILGIHIVSQGVTTCIRRSLVKANEQNAGMPAVTRSDTEANAGAEPHARTNITPVEGATHPTTPSSTDGRPPGPSPATTREKSRESTAKKKRKQANVVRSQQPLWAAIASTKVTFVKEMEQRDAVDDAREAARMDTNTPTTANNTNYTTNRVWVSEVCDAAVFFSVEVSALAAMQNTATSDADASVNTGIDKDKPFYVRINDAAWSSTRIMRSTGEDKSDNAYGDRYEGEIFGLAPLSSYKCEIVGMADQNILCSTSIITLPPPTTEQAASSSSQPAQQALRPSSPITTLKQSIQQADSKLHDTRNRSKKGKKDHRAVHSDIKRDITTFRSKLDSSGSDDKSKGRLAQISQHKSQAEEAATEIKGQIGALGDIPEDEVVGSESIKKRWKSAADAKSTSSKDFEKYKTDSDRDLSNLKIEISQTESKREKLGGRHVQRTEELEKLVSKQQAEMTAKQKRDLDRVQLVQNRDNEENQLRLHINGYETDGQKLQQKSHDAYQEIAALYSWTSQPPPYPGPPTPEGMNPTANGSLGSPQSNGFPTFGPHAFQSGYHSAQPSLSNQPSGQRGRSSSMLSQYSGFTDNGDEYSVAPEPPRGQYTWPMQSNASAGAAIFDHRREREGSGSLASGSTGSSSPRSDAKPFTPGKAAPGPIGPPNKNKDTAHSPHQSSRGPGAIGSGR